MKTSAFVLSVFFAIPAIASPMFPGSGVLVSEGDGAVKYATGTNVPAFKTAVNESEADPTVPEWAKAALPPGGTELDDGKYVITASGAVFRITQEFVPSRGTGPWTIKDVVPGTGESHVSESPTPEQLKADIGVTMSEVEPALGLDPEYHGNTRTGTGLVYYFGRNTSVGKMAFHLRMPRAYIGRNQEYPLQELDDGNTLVFKYYNYYYEWYATFTIGREFEPAHTNYVRTFVGNLVVDGTSAGYFDGIRTNRFPDVAASFKAAVLGVSPTNNPAFTANRTDGLVVTDSADPRAQVKLVPSLGTTGSAAIARNGTNGWTEVLIPDNAGTVRMAFRNAESLNEMLDDASAQPTGAASGAKVMALIDQPVTTKIVDTVNTAKNLHWDAGLSVTWTNVVHNGHIYYVTATNTNVSVLTP